MVSAMISRSYSMNVSYHSMSLQKNTAAPETAGKAAPGSDADFQMLSTLFELQFNVKQETVLTVDTQSRAAGLGQGPGIDLSGIMIGGKSLLDFTPQEASELVSADGEFGARKTAERLADFIIAGAGDDPERLKAGLKGFLKGFGEAEALFGGRLPDISYQTYDLVMEKISGRMEELGGSFIGDMAA